MKRKAARRHAPITDLSLRRGKGIKGFLTKYFSYTTKAMSERPPYDKHGDDCCRFPAVVLI